MKLHETPFDTGWFQAQRRSLSGERPDSVRDTGDAPDAATGDSAPQPSPLGEMSEKGDVLGVLGWLRKRSVLRLPPDAMEHLARAIRQKEKDLPGLIDVAFAEIAGLTLLLLVRAQLHVEIRLAEADAHGGYPSHIPDDLEKEGWIDRLERISRFFGEMCAARARIEHLNRINNEGPKKQRNRFRADDGPVGPDSDLSGARTTPSGNGHGHQAIVRGKS